MPLTELKVKGLKAKAKTYKVADFDGLYLLVNPNGSKLWRFKYRFNSREGLLAFGKYPAISLHQARERRDEARRLLATGINPAEINHQRKAEQHEAIANTFEKVAARYLEKIKIEGRADATLKKKTYFIEIANQDFGAKPIREISSANVLKTLQKYEAKGLYETAHRLRSSVGAIFRYAIANGLADNDPTFALRDALIRPKHRSRAAIVDPKKFGQLLGSISAYDGQATTRTGLELLALLATRPSELRLARWEEFDFDKDVWAIPEERMKMRAPHYVPLPAQAKELLLELREQTGFGELVFPSLKTHKKPISENTLNLALRRMGYTGQEMTAHGFRATFSSLANESGLWHPDAIERALAHLERNEVRRAYARSAFWEERVKMAEWWANQLEHYKNNFLKTPN